MSRTNSRKAHYIAGTALCLEDYLYLYLVLVPCYEGEQLLPMVPGTVVLHTLVPGMYQKFHESMAGTHDSTLTGTSTSVVALDYSIWPFTRDKYQKYYLAWKVVPDQGYKYLYLVLYLVQHIVSMPGTVKCKVASTERAIR